MQVSAPASSANLGAGFDCLALAVNLRFTLSDQPAADLLEAEATHPAVIAFREAGGPIGPLWWRSPIPPGAGLGFSGAARVAGAALGSVAGGRVDPGSGEEVQRVAMDVAARLEGHPENAAASAFGGFVVCAERVVLTPSVALDGTALVTWSPPQTSSTDSSRRALPDTVSLSDAVHNLAAASAMVVGLLTGDRDAMRVGAGDRLHQSWRLDARPASAEVLDVFGAHPAVWAAWLSGSGPTVAAVVESEAVTEVVAALPPGGASRVLAVERTGVEVADAARL